MKGRGAHLIQDRKEALLDSCLVSPSVEFRQTLTWRAAVQQAHTVPLWRLAPLWQLSSVVVVPGACTVPVTHSLLPLIYTSRIERCKEPSAPVQDPVVYYNDHIIDPAVSNRKRSAI